MTASPGRLSSVLALAIFALVAQGQTCTCAPNTNPAPIPVNVNYVPTPGGPFLKVKNCDLSATDPNDPGGCSAIVVNGKIVRLADPTILVLKPPTSRTEYYVTGTADDYGVANFPIFKSTDLVNWTFHMFAFDDGNRKTFNGDPCPSTTGCNYNAATNPLCVEAGYDDRPDGKCTNRLWKPCCDTMHFPVAGGGVRKFRHFWAPQLYQDPRDENYIYLQFTAMDLSNVPQGTPSGLSVGDLEARTRQTVFVTRMARHAFRNQYLDRTKRFGGVTNVSSPPLGYGHLPGATSATPWIDGVEGIRDGGHSLGKVIPSSGDLTDPTVPIVREACGSATGDLYYGDADAAWPNGDAPKTWMALDGAVYFDNLGSTTYQPWIIYTWRRELANSSDSHLNYFGNNIAAFPLLTNSLLDSSDQDALLPMAYRYNTLTGPTTASGSGFDPDCRTGTPNRIFNGVLNTGTASGCAPLPPCPIFGIAEGPDMLQRGTSRYLIYSHNGWTSPDYNMVYRARRVPMDQMGLPNWHVHNANEKRLLHSEGFDARTGLRGLGHGEAFPWQVPFTIAETDRYFLIFHAKNTTNNNRYPWFKELTFIAPPSPLLGEGGEGGELESDDIAPLTDHGKGGYDDATEFIVPMLCPADFNGDNVVTVDDIFIFLDSFFAMDIAADVDGNEAINPDDIFVFLDLFFAGCEVASGE